MDEDFLLAVQLQEQFDYEASSVLGRDANEHNLKKRRLDNSSSEVVPYIGSFFEPERPLSIVDEKWELVDPSPDIRALFLGFNDKFFWSKLSGVEVRWSPRMTLCAGVCSYEGRGGLCSIRLSEPLLKLRPRRDLVETLLHEMIHALLFVTDNDRDRDGHGPEFCRHMNRINKASGTNITVYHSFHDEVDQYRQHWWRCDGPCRTRRPFFGYVKRAMNRPPSARDFWWAEHQRTCGGTYAKIKEPENYVKKGKKRDGNEKTLSQPAGKSEKLPNSPTGLQDIRNIIPFTGKGYILGGGSQPSPHKHQIGLSDSPPAQSSGKDLSWLGKASPSKSTSFGESQSHTLSKKSVSNSKVFKNVNGSPVRISGTLDHLAKVGNGHKDASMRKTLIMTQLFDKLKTPPRGGVCTSTNGVCPTRVDAPRLGTASKGLSRISTSSLRSSPPTSTTTVGVCPKTDTTVMTGPSSKAKGGPNVSETGTSRPSSSGFGSLSPKQLKSADNPGSRKRSRDSGSTSLYDYFQKAANGTAQQETRAEPGSQNPLGPHSVRTDDAGLMVTCPVCQSSVQESKINVHLDSCLT